MNQIYVYIYIYIKFISILKLRSAKFIIIIAKREITDGLARVNATGSHNLSLFSKVGPSSFRNLKKKRKQEQIGRHPTGSRSSFPTKMASKYEEIHTEGNSVNDLTGFKAGKTLGKLTRKKGEGWSRLATLSSSTTLSSLAGIGRKTSSKGVLLPPCRELKAPVLPAMIRSSSGLNKALEEGSIFPVLLPGACATQGPLTGFPHHSLPEKKGGKKKDEKRCRSSDSLSGIRCIWK